MKKKQLLMFFLNAVALMIVGAFAVSSVYKYNPDAFVILLSVLAAASITMVVQLFYAKENIYKFVAKLNKNLNDSAAQALYMNPAASVIINEQGIIVWHNNFFFEEITAGKEAFGLNLRDFIDADLNALMITRAEDIKHFDKFYRIVASKFEYGKDSLFVLNFTDVTETVELKELYDLSKPSVLLITIDNYDDLLLNAKETEKAHVSVAIEQLLEEFMSHTTDILRKLSSDRFIAVIEERNLRPIIDERFKILDKARNIIVGERTNLTLSIGVGHGGKTLAESEAFAKQSLDMALGRGGDQAVVKTENGFKFYGGVSKGIEKKSRGKARIIAAALKELIQSCKKVYIMGHRFGDLDSIGSAIGLAGAIQNFCGDVHVVFDPDKNLAKPLIKRFIAAEGDSLFMSVPQAVSSFDNDSMLIIVDTHNKEYIESRDLYEAASKVVVIDHHRKTVNFIDDAVIFHHEPYASSAAEMVTEVIQYFITSSNLPPAYADALLAGIALDTKNFVMKTGVRTFEAAAVLRKYGADPIAVKKMFASSIEIYQHKAKLVANADIYNNCAIASSDITTEEIRLIAPQAADELLGIANVDASFVLYKSGDGVNISARSLGTVNVQVIMEKLGGGGHQTMAAAQIDDISIFEAKRMLIHAIEDEY